MDKLDISNLIKQEERREEARLNRSGILYVETVSSFPGSTEEPVIVACETVDFSANGIQVAMDSSLTSGAIHRMSLELPSSSERFQLTGEVRWVREAADTGGYTAGIRLFNSEGTEIIDWKLAIANWLKD